MAQLAAILPELLAGGEAAAAGGAAGGGGGNLVKNLAGAAGGGGGGGGMKLDTVSTAVNAGNYFADRMLEASKMGLTGNRVSTPALEVPAAFREGAVNVGPSPRGGNSGPLAFQQRPAVETIASGGGNVPAPPPPSWSRPYGPPSPPPPPPSGNVPVYNGPSVNTNFGTPPPPSNPGGSYQTPLWTP